MAWLNGLTRCKVETLLGCFSFYPRHDSYPLITGGYALVVTATAGHGFLVPKVQLKLSSGMKDRYPEVQPINTSWQVGPGGRNCSPGVRSFEGITRKIVETLSLMKQSLQAASGVKKLLLKHHPVHQLNSS